MSFLRRRQECRPTRGGATSGAYPWQATGDLPDPDEETNVALVSGMIVADPQRDRGRDGDPVTVLLVAFAAPDEKARPAAACCEVEIPDEIADRRRKQLRAGRRLVVLGQLTGAGGLWATAIVVSRRDPPRKQ